MLRRTHYSGKVWECILKGHLLPLVDMATIQSARADFDSAACPHTTTPIIYSKMGKPSTKKTTGIPVKRSSNPRPLKNSAAAEARAQERAAREQAEQEEAETISGTLRIACHYFSWTPADILSLHASHTTSREIGRSAKERSVIATQ